MNSIKYSVCSFDELCGCLIPCSGIKRIPKNAKAVIVGIFPYLLPKNEYAGSVISKYAVVKDYHQVVLGYLDKKKQELMKIYPNDEFACFVDSSPIPEVYAAALCGLGAIGDNGLLITKEFGSFVFIGEIVTSADIPAQKNTVKQCLHCGKCIKSCPGNALGDNAFNKNNCLSHITQKKGELTNEEKELIKKHKTCWGCDECQNVCPLNQNAAVTDIPEFLNFFQRVPDLNEDISDRAFAFRGIKVIERNLNLIKL